MSEMVERVAQAIFDATPFRSSEGSYGEQTELYRRMCEHLAIAAVKAMREPTDEIFEVAKPYGLCMSALNDAWRDMHDAILSE
jgi:hypothetical protein